MGKINLSEITSIEEGTLDFKRIFLSLLYSYGLSIILLAVFAIILTYTNFSEALIPTVVLVISIISILFAAQMASKCAKSKGWLTGSITGLLYMVILYIISLVFTQRPVFDNHVLLLFGVGFITGAIGGIIGINFKKSEKRRR